MGIRITGSALVFSAFALACSDHVTELSTPPQMNTTAEVLCGAPGTYCINSGGSQYTDLAGNIFVGDRPYALGSFGFQGPGIMGNLRDVDIAGTGDDELYRTLRSADHTTGAPFSYLFDVPNGTYEVTLYFIEPTFPPTDPRQRFFDVFFEDVLMLDNFNPSFEAGARRAAVWRVLTATVADGQLNIRFVSQSKELYNTVPMVSGLKVVSTSPPAPVADIRVSPTSLDFGSVIQGQSADRDVTIDNDGTEQLTVNSLTTDNASFVVVSPEAPITIAAGGTATATVRFFSAELGTNSGNLVISSDDPDESTVSVALTATAEPVPPPPAPEISVTPSSVDFGSVIQGETADRAVAIMNDGSATLTVNGLASDNGVFTVVTPAVPFTIAPGSSVAATVRFAPVTLGSAAGNLTVNSDDADEASITVPLAGVGTEAPPPPAPEIEVPLNLAFGDVRVGSTAQLPLVIRNTGTANLQVNSLISSNGAFAVTSGALPITIGAGSSSTVTVSFTPSAIQAEAGTITVGSDDADESSLAVDVTGTGTATPLTIRINGGGPDYTAQNGDLFVGDRAYVAGSFGFVGGSQPDFGGPIGNTHNDPLYTGSHAGVDFSFLADVPNGAYLVTLHFSEYWFNTVGSRVFDVSAENVVVLDNYDVVREAGTLKFAIQESFTVNVSDGQLNLRFFGPRAGIVAGIEIVQQ